MDLKEAVQAAAPADVSADMPEDRAQRVVEGARHLSPHLRERMRAIQLFGRSIFIRELLPQATAFENQGIDDDVLVGGGTHPIVGYKGCHDSRARRILLFGLQGEDLTVMPCELVVTSQ